MRQKKGPGLLRTPVIGITLQSLSAATEEPFPGDAVFQSHEGQQRENADITNRRLRSYRETRRKHEGGDDHNDQGDRN